MSPVLDTKKVGPGGREAINLATWLEQRCREEGLSYRQAAAKAGISHASIAGIRKGARPSAATIVKLARAFADEGSNQKVVLEDYLLGLCGYRSTRPEITRSEPLARLMDKLSQCDAERLKLIEYFVDFSATLGDGKKPWRNQNP
jgi:transcriptional regulator with XRE-family HTH domain